MKSLLLAVLSVTIAGAAILPAGAKDAHMLAPSEAERVTGYHVGGISPFGQKKRARTFVDRAALAHATVLVNGGRRGLQIEIAPGELVRLLEATPAEL